MNVVEPIREIEKVEEIYNTLKKENKRNAMLFLFGIYTRIKNIRYFKIQG